MAKSRPIARHIAEVYAVESAAHKLSALYSKPAHVGVFKNAILK
jgi:hypothetical protein